MNEIKKWNKFIELMISTKKAWESLAGISRMAGGTLENLPPKAQKTLIIANPKAKFEVAMPRLMDYWRGYGGLDSLMIPVKKEKKETEDARTE